MPSPRVLIGGLVQRLLPSPAYDDGDVDKPARLGRYRENFVVSLVRKQYGLIDEGSYFLVHNAQTGIASSLIGVAFSETTISPYLLVYNTDTGDKGKSINLDYLNLICTVAGIGAAALTNLMFAWTLDPSGASRYTSGGTDLTGGAAANGGIVSPNSAVPKRASIAQIYAGALTLAAASANRRIIVPQRLLRVQNSGTAAAAVQDEFRMNFGAVEHVNPSSLVDLTTAKTVAYREHFQLPGIAIQPGAAAILHLWSPGAALTTGISFLPEMGWSER